jgi:hypothetical protein
MPVASTPEYPRSAARRLVQVTATRRNVVDVTDPYNKGANVYSHILEIMGQVTRDFSKNQPESRPVGTYTSIGTYNREGTYRAKGAFSFVGTYQSVGTYTPNFRN